MTAMSTPVIHAPAAPRPATDDGPEAAGEPVEALVEEELLVEEISIDGMCGVY